MGQPIEGMMKKIHQIWSDKDGLPQNSITCISQDSRGWIWIGTLDGVAFYNGIKLQSLNLPKPATSNAIPRNGLVCATDGAIWLAGSNGWLFQLKPTLGAKPTEWKWQSFRLSSLNGAGRILCLSQTADGRVLVGTDSGLVVQKGNEFSTMYGNQLLSSRDLTQPILSILPAKNGSMYCGTQNGLLLISPQKFSFIDFPAKISSSPTSLAQSSNRVIIIGTEGNGLFKYVRASQKIVPYKNDLPSSYITSLVQGAHSTLYVGTNKGVGIISSNSEFVAEKDGLSNQVVLSLFKLGNSQLFIGTEVGLSILSPDAFKTLDPSEGLSHSVVWSISEDSRGRFYFGTTAGLNIYDEHTGKIQTVLDSLTIRDVKPLNAQTLFLATNKGLFRLHNNLATPILPQIFQDETITGLVLLNKKQLYIGTAKKGLYRLNAQNLKLENPNPILPNNYIYTIALKDSTSLYVGTRGHGLFTLNPKNCDTLNTHNGLINNDVRSILPDDYGVWIGTNGGLTFWQSNRFYHFDETSKPALPNNVIYRLEKDSQNRIYGLTNRGIFRLSPSFLHDSLQVKIETFTTDDGLPSMEGNAGASFVDSKGRLWFGTVKGAAMSEPGKIRPTQAPLKTLLNGVFVHGENLEETKKNAKNDPLVLAHNQNHLTFKFACLTFKREHETRFQTQLIGFDTKPSQWFAQSQKEYTNLPAGNYTFKVQAKNYAGILAQPEYFYFSIEPAPWATPLAYASYIILIGFSLYGLNHLNTQRLKNRQRELEHLVQIRTREVEAQKNALQKSNQELLELNELKTRFLSIASHDLKNPLQSILGYSELIQEEAEQNATISKMAQSISRASQKMLGIIKDLLDTSAIESGKLELNKSVLDFSELVAMVCDDFQMMLEKKSQTLTINTEAGCVIMADASRLREVIENLISNASKYTPNGGKISVRIKRIQRKSEHIIQCAISDTGLGLSAEDQKKIFGKFQKLSARPTAGESSTGLGLSIVKQLVELHGGKVWAESAGKDCGSTFFIELPEHSTSS